MKLIFQALFITTALLISGCSIKTDVLTAQESAALDNKTLVYIDHSELPDFVAQTATTVQFGIFGLASAIDSGNTMIQEHNIKDPAIDIAKQLADELTAEHHVTVTHNKSNPINDEEIPVITTQFKKYDYILDVKTLGWGSIYFVSDWNNYRVLYNVHARLIDTHNAKVVAENECSFDPKYEDTDKAPSYDDLEKGNGLARELKKAIKYCVNYIHEQANLSGKKIVVAAKKTSDEDDSL